MDQQQFYQFMKKTLQFLVLVSFFSSTYSYFFSGFPFFVSCNIQFSTLFFPLFAHALDKKYMFLVCNGILAFLANNLKLSSSSVKQITELPPPLSEDQAQVQENMAAMEFAAEEEEQQDYADIHNSDTEIKTADIVLESGESQYEEEEDEEEQEQEQEEEDNRAIDRVEEVKDDTSVSTEELNNKFEEFIRKMKEEIRIQQQLVTIEN